MKVLVANKCGFCFGVTHAIQMAEEMLEQGRNVYCLGSLIHNKQVVDRLTQAGLKVVENLDEIPSNHDASSDKEIPTVLIRSHGCSPDLIEKVRQRGFRLADATCVLVKRAQKLVGQLHRQGYQVIVVGDPDHPEIQGVMGYAPEVCVVKNEQDLDCLPPAKRWAVISQTTYSSQDFGRIVGKIAARDYRELKVLNTICRETTLRQVSAIELCRKVEVMFVLGSKHSANTGELANICRHEGVTTYHLQNYQEFEPRYIAGKGVAGVTAGASTPDWIISEFVDNLKAL